jgi:ABC-type uncharacterized transport system ATPase subunit
MEQAEKLCDHIGLISHGRLVLGGELKEIKRQAGGNSYRLVAPMTAEDLERVRTLPGVALVTTRDLPEPPAPPALAPETAVRLLLAPGASGPALLRRLVEFLAVREFRSEEPDLEDIFIKAVRDAA